MDTVYEDETLFMNGKKHAYIWILTTVIKGLIIKSAKPGLCWNNRIVGLQRFMLV